MSVIENTLKRLQGQRGGSAAPPAGADGKGYGTVMAAASLSSQAAT